MDDFSNNQLSDLCFALQCMIERLQSRLSDPTLKEAWVEYYSKELDKYIFLKNKVESYF